MNAPYLGSRSAVAEIWSVRQPRTAQIILPRGTRTELARRAVEAAVRKWLDALDVKQHLELLTDIDIEGPTPCPFIEQFGEDMWLATGLFRSRKPRLVHEDVVVAGRELAGDAKQVEGLPDGVRAMTAPPSMPDDAKEQLTFVAENEDTVYDDLMELEAMKRDQAKQPATVPLDERIRRARAG